MKKFKVEMEIETHDILDHKNGIITAVELKQLIEIAISNDTSDQ